MWAGIGTGSSEGITQLVSPETLVTRDDALAVCHQSCLWPVCSLELVKPCFESAKCLSLLQSTVLTTVLNAWEAGEMCKGYLLLSRGAELALCTLAYKLSYLLGHVKTQPENISAGNCCSSLEPLASLALAQGGVLWGCSS